MVTRFFVITCVLVSFCHASVITINSEGTGDYPSVQAAIDAANAGDEVVLEPGIYKGAGNRDIDFKGKAITVRSIAPNDKRIVGQTIIDCETIGRGFYFHTGENTESILTGITIKNGYAESDGGGILCDHASPTITKCSFVGGSVGNWGGGIQCYASSAVIIDCVFTGNSAREGGAITIRESDSPQISDCYMYGNTASDSGGGINCDVLSAPSVHNCLITGNYAGNYGGGGISIFQCMARITNCTIVNNYANSGSGILDWYPYGDGSTIENCIVWGNIPEFEQMYFSSTARLTINHCDIQYGLVLSGVPQVNWGDGNIEDDPQFVAGELGDYYLNAATGEWWMELIPSPCIDSGSALAADLGMDTYTTDIALMPDSGIVDIGYHYPIMNSADINSDGAVNYIDYRILASQWDREISTPSADIFPSGGDGVVGIEDIELMWTNWLTD